MCMVANCVFKMVGNIVLYLFVLSILVTLGDGNTNQKRLLLNDPDVANRLASMESMINTLTQQMTEIKAGGGAGSTYTRWGRSVCTGDHTELVYSGYAAGQLYIHTSYTARYGGPSNMLCLPHDPEPSNITANGLSLLYGTEYEENILAPDAANEDVPCAVCRSTMTQTSIMIPGRKTCYSGWKKEYNGLIASGHRAYTSSSYICLDKNIEYIPSGKVNNDGALLYITTLKCGSLPCPPYHNDKAINCVVCSK